MAGHYAVIGAGGWGTAVAVHLANQPGFRVTLCGLRTESVQRMAESRENARQLPGVTVPTAVTITADPAAVADADAFVVAVPTAFLRDGLERFRRFVPDDRPVLSLTKGIETTTFERPTEMIADVLGATNLAVLSGPSHAEEVARGLPTSVVIASPDTSLAARFQAAFGSDRFRVYTNGDLIGVELAGALKNIIGIAAGVCDGLGYGDNAKAALLTRGMVEMTRFGVAHGADPATFAGLAGIGDLMTTCFSRHGRNRKVGERLGRGESLADVTSGPQVAEGVYTCRSVYDRARQMGLDVPIMAGVYRLVHAGESPRAIVQELMTRRPRGEGRHGG
jgi:glycerol-3-phosphate dehydrogenase (NAD(P)+)